MRDDCDGKCDSNAPSWWCPRYRNCGTIEEYLGDPQATAVEVVAVRVAQWMNGCASLDWCYENLLTTILREIGPGLRISQFLTAASVVFVTPLFLEVPLLFEHDVFHPNPDMMWGDVTISVAFYLWAVDFALLALSWMLIRYHGTPAQCGDAGQCTPFYRVTTRQLREQRALQKATLPQQLVRWSFAALFGVFFVLGIFATHTTLSHMYVRQNKWFAYLLVLQMVLVATATLDDLTQIGSPWGIQESSKTASVLLSFRALILIPVTLIWSIAAIFASFPH